MGLIIEAKEMNDLFEKICREMDGKKRANNHFPEVSSNSKWHDGVRLLKL